MVAIFVLDTSEGNWGHIGERPRRSDGSYLERTDLSSPRCTLAVNKKGMGPDLVRTVGSIHLFSVRAKEQMEHLDAPPDTGWVKVAVSSRTEAATYFALVSQTDFDVIDKTQSEFSWLVPNKVMGKVTKWVLIESSLPEFDFFVADKDEETEVCPRCGEPAGHEQFSHATLLGMATVWPLFPVRRRFSCDECGHVWKRFRR